MKRLIVLTIIVFILGCFSVAAAVEKELPKEGPTIAAAKAQDNPEDLTMTNGDLRILLSDNSIRTLMTSTAISPALKFKLLLLIKKLNVIATTVEEVRQEIMAQYAEVDEEGKKIIKKGRFDFGDKNEKVLAKIDELLDETFTIPKGRITINLSTDLPPNLLSAQDLINLSVLLDFKEK